MWERQGGKCIYCGNSTWLKSIHRRGKPTHKATLEHIVPRNRGGTHSKNNLACSCLQCNSTRGEIDHSLFLKIRKQSNWQQLAKEEKWKLLGIYRKKKIEQFFKRLPRKYPIVYKLKKHLTIFTKTYVKPLLAFSLVK
jgi:hypothetical protein